VQLKPDVNLYQGSKGVTLKYTADVKSIQYIDYVINQTSMLDMQQYARIELTG
jgi:hypothetical protein